MKSPALWVGLALGVVIGGLGAWSLGLGRGPLSKFRLVNVSGASATVNGQQFSDQGGATPIAGGVPTATAAAGKAKHGENYVATSTRSIRITVGAQSHLYDLGGQEIDGVEVILTAPGAGHVVLWNNDDGTANFQPFP